MKIITLAVVDQLDAPVANVARVAVFQSSVLVTYQDTDANGQAELLLDEGDYVVRTILTSGNAYETPATLSLTVSENASYTITVNKVDPSVVAGPNQCICMGTITIPTSYEEAFEIQQLLSFGFRDSSNTDIHYPAPVVLRAKDGELLLAALPKDTRFRVATGRFPSWETKTPDLASVAMSDFLFPLLRELVFAGPSVSLSVGTTTEVAYQERYESGVLLDPAEEGSLVDQVVSEEKDTDGVTFSSSDNGVVVVSKGAGVISLTPISAGTATISAVIQQLFGIDGAVESLDDILTVVVS